jgi:hypothetical protein
MPGSKHWSGLSSGWKNWPHQSKANHVASRAQITRLAQRIEDLAESAASRPPRKIVRISQDKYLGETEDEAVNKYFAQHPEDVGRDIILSVYI